MPGILFVNGIIVNEGLVYEGGLYVEGDTIADVWASSDPDALALEKKYRGLASEVIDISGRYIAPGLIDEHVHFREPGATHKGCIASESAAAVLGGVTSYMDMPNNNPPAVSEAALLSKEAVAAGGSYANYAFYIGATSTNLCQIVGVNPRRVCGVKVFMGSSTGNLLVDDKAALHRIFAESDIPVAVHCEDNAIIAENLESARDRYGDDIPFEAHPLVRSREACVKSSAAAIELARETGAHVHITHLSTAEEVDMVAAAKKEGVHVTAETCVQYLFFDDSAYAELGPLVKCNPAIKRASDRRALLDAVRSGVIDTIATDHAPHLLAEKQTDYLHSPSGIPLVQFSLLMMLDLVAEGKMKLTSVFECAAHAPARIWNVRFRGFLRKGYKADIVVFDMNRPSEPSVASRCGWSPVGKFYSSVIHTVVNGTFAVRDGKLCDSRPKVCALEFDR